MKKFLICVLVLVLFGCSKNTKEVEQKSKTYYNNYDTFIQELEIEGHKYIIYSGYHAGNIIHAEHCPCHKN